MMVKSLQFTEVRRETLPTTSSKTKSLISFLIALIALSAASLSYADEKLFVGHCGACHTLNQDQPRRQGPYLGNVIGRQAGAVSGFPYSASVKALGLTWDAESLDRWLENPQHMAADSYMMYQQKDAAVRRSIIDYLSTL